MRILPALFFSITALLASGCEQSTTSQDTIPAEPPVDAVDVAEAPDNQSPSSASAPQVESAAVEIDWDALIPAEWSPDTIMNKYDADNLSDDDPRANELMAELKALWDEAPVVDDLDGKRVKLPGFVVPVEMDDKEIDEFLLVPYYGACIHVPPPPANQTVHVTTRNGHAWQGQLFDTVWVTGTIRVERHSSELAEAGYLLLDATVEPYE